MGCTSSADEKKKKNKGDTRQQYSANAPYTHSSGNSSPPAGATSAAQPVHHNAQSVPRSGYKARPKIPAPDCSAHELAMYLATYTMMPSDPGPTGANDEHDPMHAKYHRGRRKTVADTPYNKEQEENYTPKEIRKNPQEVETLLRVLPGLPMFSHLDERELETIVKTMAHGVYRQGDKVIEHGSSEGDQDRMYIIADGQCTIVQEDRSRTLTRGMVFGELELLYMQPRAATVTVESAVMKTWELTREDYRHLLRNASMRKRKVYGDLLKRISFLKSMRDSEMIQLADCLQASNYRSGEKLIEYDSDGEWMYIILEGTVEVVGRDPNNGKPVHVVDFSVGAHVGELEFINNHKCVADVVARGAVRTAKLNRNHFELCMGPVMDFLKRNASTDNPTYNYYNQARAER